MNKKIIYLYTNAKPKSFIMKYFFALLLSVFFSPACIYAQQNLKPGYIINLKGDTLKGVINYREWDQTPNTVGFKTASDAAIKKYTLDDINGFGVTGNAYFLKFELPISYDYTEVNKISSRPTDSTAVHTVFLKVVATGNIVNLYSYTDLIKTRYFLQYNAANQIEELTYHIYYTDGTITFPKKVMRFRLQLQSAAQNAKMDNPRLSNKIQSARYQEDDLTEIVQAINKTSEATFTAEKLFKARFFTGASYVRSTLTYDFGDPANKKSVSNSAPKIDAGIDLIFNKNTERLIFRIEAGYVKNKFALPIVSNSFSSYVYYLNQQTFSVSPQVVYNLYSKNNVKAFISAGVLYNHYVYDNYTIATVSNGPPTKETGNNVDLLTSSVHFAFKAGFTLSKHFELNVGYTLPSEVTGVASASFVLKSYQAGINYLF
jgi:hypothetical protein